MSWAYRKKPKPFDTDGWRPATDMRCRFAYILLHSHQNDVVAVDQPSVATATASKPEERSEMKPLQTAAAFSLKAPIKFRIPTAEILVPIRLDIEIDGVRLRDVFTWNPNDPDQDVIVFARRTVRDLKLPPAFITHISQSVQSQLNEFRALQGQDMYPGDKMVLLKLDLRVNQTLIRDQFLWDLNNFESDPEEFAKTVCKDMNIKDPEVGPAIAVAIREQLYEIAVQNVASAKEMRVIKKSRRASDLFPASKVGGTSVDLMKYFSYKSSVVRKRREWDVYEPIVDHLTHEEVAAIETKKEKMTR